MVVDLSIPVFDGMNMFSTFPAVQIADYWTYEQTASRYLEPCKGCKVTKLSMVDHTGTHVDSPSHFIIGGKTISEVPVDAYSGAAVSVDVSEKGDDHILTLELFQRYLNEQQVKLEEGMILVLRCTKKQYLDPDFLKVQALSEQVAYYIVSKKIKAVGLDLMAVDSLEDMRRPSHMILLGNGVLIIEGLANLDKLPSNRFILHAYPLYLEKASGSPVRAVGVFS